jgi:hypothetical protein
VPETWSSRRERYLEAKTSGSEERWHDLKADLQKDLAHEDLSEGDMDWLTGALRDANARWFVEFALRHSPPPFAEPLFDPLIRAAVYERDPSFNRVFIEPCIRSAGWQRTVTGSAEVRT